MNSFKLLVVFVLLLLGSFAQCFQRHFINGIQNGNSVMESLDTLSSDGNNYEQNSGDVKFVGNEREGIELELGNKKLVFKFCSDECMDKVVIVNSKDLNPLRKGGCDPGECEFKAGVSEEGENKLLWFSSIASNTPISDLNGICKTTIMKYPQATPDGILQFASCAPLKHDGNVVKLYVRQAKRECPLFVLYGKKCTPPTTTTTTTKTTQNASETNQTTFKSSEANTTLWIGIGVGIFILLIVIIGFGFVLFIVKSVNAPKSKSLSGKKDSLSGRHETGMQGMVESPPESLKHHDFGLLNNETKKLEKFYTPDPVRIFDRREIELLCCAKISVIFKSIEVLIDITIKALAERGLMKNQILLKCLQKLRNIYTQSQHQNLFKALLLEMFFVNILIHKQEFMKHFQFLFFGQVYFNDVTMFSIVAKHAHGFAVNFQLSKKNSLQKNVQN